MRYVILRDDDTNALTPVHCLERLYRPFLDHGLPVNLAVIPEVRTDVSMPDGRREGFLPSHGRGVPGETRSLASNRVLTGYLKANPGLKLVQHGCHHDYFEFELDDIKEIARRLEHGAQRFVEAGFEAPRAFVAPYDRFSRVSLAEAARRFRVVSTGWFERRRLPLSWWPRYIASRLLGEPHLRAGRTSLLTHPGCLLSRFRRREGMLNRVREAVNARQLTVLVTHWWEYFPEGRPDRDFIRILHETAEYLASRPDVKVVSFDDLADGRVPLA